MTIRHNRKTGSIYLHPDPGAVICRNCPVTDLAICDESSHHAGSVRQKPERPACLIDYLYWRLRYTTPAQALRIGDQAAAETLARGKAARWWYRIIEIYADRAAFVAGLANRKAKERTEWTQTNLTA